MPTDAKRDAALSEAYRAAVVAGDVEEIERLDALVFAAQSKSAGRTAASAPPAAVEKPSKD